MIQNIPDSLTRKHDNEWGEASETWSHITRSQNNPKKKIVKNTIRVKLRRSSLHNVATFYLRWIHSLLLRNCF